MKRINRPVTAIAAAVSLLFAQGAVAQQTAQSSEMSIPEVVAQLEAQGYTEFHEIERENGRYEVLVSKADGQTFEIYLDATTGETLKVERANID